LEKTATRKLSKNIVVQLEDNLIYNKPCQPTEFSRHIQTTHQVKHWKELELRTFLLYVGPVMSKNVLAEREYQHFIKYCHSNNEQNRNFTIFVKSTCIFNWICFRNIVVRNPLFGNQCVGYNFHHLIHLAREVEIFPN
jgi:hypothetical protein